MPEVDCPHNPGFGVSPGTRFERRVTPLLWPPLVGLPPLVLVSWGRVSGETLATVETPPGGLGHRTLVRGEARPGAVAVEVHPTLGPVAERPGEILLGEEVSLVGVVDHLDPEEVTLGPGGILLGAGVSPVGAVDHPDPGVAWPSLAASKT